jgi:fibronectin-binding autotransporter adhesin
LRFLNQNVAMKKLTLNAVKLIASTCLLFAPFANNVWAQVYTWNPQGNGPYTGTMSGNWGDAAWSSGDGTTTATPVIWPAGAQAEFGPNTLIPSVYTITMDASQTIAGLYNGYLKNYSCDLTINGPGSISLADGQCYFGVNNSSGNLGDGRTTINSVISGLGTLTMANHGSSGGALYLNGANTYSGGTSLGYSVDSWGGIIYFNNKASFGTGAIAVNRGSGSTLAFVGTSAITITNRFVNNQTGASLNLVGNEAGVTFSGAWVLGTHSLSLGAGGTANDVINISGVISGTGGLTKFGPGKLTLSGANTYTGSTTISEGTLALGRANAIATSSTVIMNGGILDPTSFNQALSSTKLGLTAASTIDFGGGNIEVDFANSSSLTWSGVLNLANWDPSTDKLRIGTDTTGLTEAQLGLIEFNGANLGVARLDSTGVILIPEPSTAILGLVGGLGVLWMVRRRAGSTSR